MKKKDLITSLKEELKLLEAAQSVLQDSYDSCKKTGIKKKYLRIELLEFEALTSRFARTSDIFIQKILRLIDEIDREQFGSPRDRINRAEKKGVVKSAEKLIDIRDLRNKIAHEYSVNFITDIFKDVLQHSAFLISCINQLKSYCKKYF